MRRSMASRPHTDWLKVVSWIAACVVGVLVWCGIVVLVLAMARYP